MKNKIRNKILKNPIDPNFDYEYSGQLEGDRQKMKARGFEVAKDESLFDPVKEEKWKPEQRIVCYRRKKTAPQKEREQIEREEEKAKMSTNHIFQQYAKTVSELGSRPIIKAPTITQQIIHPEPVKKTRRYFVMR